ncbi:MAG: hypothetical protein CO031_00575 [Candidatus Nealsonbacteria bacterium CG_4_9_14_0_2_um_filter_37_38]|uniref:DhaL domain-containing protein n=1 Tax=Candidatus Nealsonbacteria bacterium CG_4_10_14_0_8_um_filter_37_14 TaxID=1974684 RepID=A0A2M7R5W5_9BACT|nr:MAG: hypothetical protein COV63_02265 [Candidatus Nealsonbacteria bacterium CG11_big_fil_rev_8_21_14_0_20_37_68]PIW91835.1 MAG: hypothetical protein COZ89_03120 [Candidatus Nealsonbacteria bacterium CG_4_8_14_3_um_filter_37_23]PIY88779.1 MAG: hypothetical protein COY73_02820 [Candidatus Nealsonbacteria bacterium CG_4_10_14_0_8_um_filter_37_14]PJC51830.1 MAG: hypothetical protein CO031_00575 [Candidatus Nealsonbacteria bacterium CG_4_9_14_0_2_um_filter_37_38]
MDKIQKFFVSEMEISKDFLRKIFEKFYARISPRKEEVNKMNYFPIPDCDTGDNLAATLRGVIRGIKQGGYLSKKDLINSLQEEILLEAGRGNAGVIFTGWFAGFLNSLKEGLVLNAETLSQAMEEGKNWGYRVFDKPREGTILDPISISAQTALLVSQREKNLISLFEEIISRAKISVEKTTEKLDDLLKERNTPREIKALKKKKVVDAGALGFLIFLESFQEVIMEKIKERGGAVVVIKGKENLDREVFKKRFSPLGDSLDINISPSSKNATIHIHTDFPEKIAEISLEFGEIKDFRIEDLTEEV